MKPATVEQMREMDRQAIEKLGIAEEVLMENAAHAAISLAERFRYSGQDLRIFCGIVNNGATAWSWPG